MTAQERMVRTRTRLLLDHPWFGSLAMRLKMQETDCPKMQTDGSVLNYNADFVAKQSDAHLLTIMAHEVLHCALLHPWRRGARDKDTWNRACDYAINGDLVKAGFVMPPDALYDTQYAGLSADTIFAKLYAKPKDPNDTGNEEPCTGTVEDGEAPSHDSVTGMTEEDWKIAGEQATAVSKAAGSLPGDAVRSTKAARQVPEDWRAILREFIEHQTPSDYSWGSPNRRYIAEGLYLPGIVKENLGYIGVCVDTSGSIDAKVLAAFAQELTALVQEARPARVSVVYCDAEVRGDVQEFTPDDLEINLEARGGGGTRFAPALKHFADAEESPAAVLYFTDLENGMETLEEPAFPVLWVTGKNVTKSAPFGPLIRIDAHM